MINLSMPHRPARKAGIREINEVGKFVVESPELGAYRVRAALEQIGIKLSQTTCGRLSALNRDSTGGLPPKVARNVLAKRCPSKPAIATSIGVWT